MPVYNGEAYIVDAVESLLAQTLPDFALVIVDNASTDRTSEICHAFAARDSRVHYHRNPRNVGLAANWNLAFDLAPTARYFKWAAHDDIHAPTFLARCVKALDERPEAVLAFSRAAFIDGQGNTLSAERPVLPLDSNDPAARLDALMPSDRLFIFGVIRRDALRRQGRPVIGAYIDHDGVVLLRLALAGPFVEVPEVLFYSRRHESQAEARFRGHGAEWTAWLAPSQAGTRSFPTWRKHAELWRALAVAPLSVKDRVRCALTLARWGRWKRRELYRELASPVRDLLRPGRRSGGRGRTMR